MQLSCSPALATTTTTTFVSIFRFSGKKCLNLDMAKATRVTVLSSYTLNGKFQFCKSAFNMHVARIAGLSFSCAYWSLSFYTQFEGIVIKIVGMSVELFVVIFTIQSKDIHNIVKFLLIRITIQRALQH